MYHQNLGSRRFTNLTRELLYETPRAFSGTYNPSNVNSPNYTRSKDTRPSYGSGSSSPVGSLRKKHTPQASKIAAAAAFAEEKETSRRTRRERVSSATTVREEAVIDIDDELKDEAKEGFRRNDRTSSATLSIVLNQFEQEMGRNSSRGGTAEGEVGEYSENLESRVPNVPYKSVTHPDVAQVRTDTAVDSTGNDKALAKPTWKKKPLQKISNKAQGIKQKFDDQKGIIREKIPFLRNGGTMDRIRETFKFSRFAVKK